MAWKQTLDLKILISLLSNSKISEKERLEIYEWWLLSFIGSQVDDCGCRPWKGKYLIQFFRRARPMSRKAGTSASASLKKGNLTNWIFFHIHLKKLEPLYLILLFPQIRWKKEQQNSDAYSIEISALLAFSDSRNKSSFIILLAHFNQKLNYKGRKFLNWPCNDIELKQRLQLIFGQRFS